MRGELHAEWTKLRTVPDTGWLLLAAVVVTAATGAVASAVVTCPAGGCDQDPVRIAFAGVQVGQLVLAVLAVLAVGGEYSTGMIHTTLTAMPRRTAVLTAKAAVVAGLTLLASTVAVLASVLAARLVLPGSGYPPLADGPTLRAAAGSVVYLVSIALLCLGIATAARSSAAAIATAFGLLYVLPIVAVAITDPGWQRALLRIAPMSAGLAVQFADPNTGPWTGLGVLAGWAGAALLAGGLVFRLRDA